MATNNQLRRHCACHACRRGKLKCTGERPTCNNCKRKPVPQCTYDHPPGDEIWIAYPGQPNQPRRATQASNPPMKATTLSSSTETPLQTQNTLLQGIYDSARQNATQAPISFPVYPPVGAAYGAPVYSGTNWVSMDPLRPDILPDGDFGSGAFPSFRAPGPPQSFNVNAPGYPDFIMPESIYHDVQGVAESYIPGNSYGEARVPRSVYPTPWM